MDWNKYKSFGNNYYDCKCDCKVNFWDIINNKNVNEYKDVMDGVVADVTDSYKELSSERVKE